MYRSVLECVHLDHSLQVTHTDYSNMDFVMHTNAIINLFIFFHHIKTGFYSRLTKLSSAFSSHSCFFIPSSFTAPFSPSNISSLPFFALSLSSILVNSSSKVSLPIYIHKKVELQILRDVCERQIPNLLI